MKLKEFQIVSDLSFKYSPSFNKPEAGNSSNINTQNCALMDLLLTIVVLIRVKN